MAPMEIQELATLMARGFDAIDRRFDLLQTSFDEFRREVLGHFDAVYRRLERLEQEYIAITASMRRIDRILEDHERRLR
jgi:uncharacterized membrane-anchored protein YhcB (DUF1043 family)